MARIEWTRYSGDDVEAVVGMLLCSAHPNAVRVRPSQGDGGIDVFIPGPRGFGADRAVYQVKRYSENLTSSQKRKIKGSFKRVVETAQKEGWRITKWHLVMPLDLTKQNLGWLDELTSDAEFPCETHGLLLCDTLASQYPNVVDYYLRDGKERMQAALSDLTAVLSGRKERRDGEALVPEDVVPDLVAIYKVLNACDPFYKYSYSVSDDPPAPNASPAKPGLVAVSAMKRDSVWITIEIFARSQVSLEESPISLQFRLMIPDDNEELRQQVQRFIDYGAPLSMPEGTVQGTLELPAGLGGDLANASLQVTSVIDRMDADETELKIAMLASDSEAILAKTELTRTDYSFGQNGGFRTVWADKADLFTIEMDADTNGHINFHLNVHNFDLHGLTPSKIVNSLQFLAAMHAPNRLAFGSPYGPEDFNIAGTAPGEADTHAQRWAVVVQALARIQDHIATRLAIPSDMTTKQAYEITDAAKLLSGEPITGELTGPFTINHDQRASQLQPEAGRIYEFAAIKEVTITLGTQEIPICKESLFVYGRYLEIGDEQSKIEPVSKGASILYTGDVEPGQVLARPFNASPPTEDAHPQVNPGSKR
ncbi:restriction endonuclease [Mycobacteroides abscessus]|uniref:Restriction endonuclease type IV Mrr domain-containing protein n=1 Tax=Mycobacteroides abscessus TaxID=36809 RepID=A0ABD7HFH2_9MYCO|nr:restriction endonuclease [Mycobacteroides abscessus]RIR12620.1 hypothetical protein D2E27_14955 [Mycobacteroides abscessus]RIS01593.1 hypothetical protein D2E58_12800 [Mycobacteroides abscessus]RIT26279.1 hypothetical protein D2E76_28310 [Mycobacteroides abscessus]